MELNIIFGILLIATGAFSAGSFAVPFGRIKGWKWETYWMVFSFGAYIIMPLLASLFFMVWEKAKWGRLHSPRGGF